MYNAIRQQVMAVLIVIKKVVGKNQQLSADARFAMKLMNTILRDKKQAIVRKGQILKIHRVLPPGFSEEEQMVKIRSVRFKKHLPPAAAKMFQIKNFTLLG